MVNGHAPESRVMADTVTNLLGDIFDYFDVNIDPADFEYYLTENGFMLVPIEDPTNLRYGADE